MTEKAVTLNYATKTKIRAALKQQGLKIRQTNFVIEYITNGYKAKDAAKTAGYSEWFANSDIYDLKEKPRYQEAIATAEQILANETEKNYVTKDQLLEYWADVIFKKEGVKEHERLKASELIAKYLLMFPKDGESGGNTFVNINLTPEEKRDFFVQAVQKIAPAFTKNQKSEEEILEMKKKWGLQTYQPPAENGL